MASLPSPGTRGRGYGLLLCGNEGLATHRDNRSPEVPADHLFIASPGLKTVIKLPTRKREQQAVRHTSSVRQSVVNLLEGSIMTFRGWLNLVDSLSPRCPRCNRRFHNVYKCNTCGTRFCSESCSEKHFKLIHGPEIARKRAADQISKMQTLMKQNAAALAAAKQELEDLRRQREQAAIAREKARQEREREKEQAAIAREREREKRDRKLDQLEDKINKARELYEARQEQWRQLGSPRIEPA